MSTRGKIRASYLGSDDPTDKFTDYYPEWVNQLAEDVTLEGSMLDGVVQGRESVRNIVLAIRSLYEHQEWYFAGEVGDNVFIEDYISAVRGEPIGCVMLARYNSEGKVGHIAASRSEEHTSELQSRQYLVCRLLLEKKKKPKRFRLVNYYHVCASS